MPRSYQSSKSDKNNISKGQWFIISAVVVSGAFLAISFLFRSYYDTDTSSVTRYDEDFHFQNIKEQFDNTIKLSNCANLEKNLKEFVYFAEQRMQENGYLLVINYTIVGCEADVGNVRRGILLASENAVLYDNINPADVIPGYE